MSYEVDILVNGKPVKRYFHNSRWYIEAKENSEYTVRIRNSSWSRILAIATVDGINVIDGKAGGKSDQGYIISAQNSYQVKGFRTSNDTVNAFKFAKKDKSYAAKSDETGGDTSNCGVIGVQFYSEKIKPAPIVIRNDWYTFPKRSNPWYNPDTIWTTTLDSAETNQFDMVRCVSDGHGLAGNSNHNHVTARYLSHNVSDSKANFDLGTQFSNKELQDSVREVEWETGYLLQTIEIYYASREALEEMGVQLDKEIAINSYPKAFPSKFCKPPKD